MIDLINRLYRKIFCRGGYGVHSPFVFDLITTVIEEKQLYYCYERLHPVRLQILQHHREVTIHDDTLSVKKALKKYCFTELEDRLLFRLANRFQPETMLVVGSDFGLTPLYLTAYSSRSACIVVEPQPSIAAIAQLYLKEHASASIDMRNSFADMPEVLDFVVWGGYDEPFSQQTFERLLPHVHENSVLVIAGINASSNSQKTWKTLCTHPKVTVSIDLYRLGILFFNPKLHQSAYINYFT